MMRPPPALPKAAPRALFLMYAPIKVVYQVLQLVVTLVFCVQRPTHILVQVNTTCPGMLRRPAHGYLCVHVCALILVKSSNHQCP